MGHSLGQFWTSQGIPYPVWKLGGSLCVVFQFTLYQRSVLLLGHWAGIHLVWSVGLRLPLCSLLIGGQASYQLSDKGPLGLHCQLCSGCGSSRSGHLPSVAHVMKTTREVVSTRNSKCREGAGLYRCSVVSPPASLPPSCLSKGGILGLFAGFQATPWPQTLYLKSLQAPRTRGASPFSMGGDSPGAHLFYTTNKLLCSDFQLCFSEVKGSIFKFRTLVSLQAWLSHRCVS